jgi:hypothetical protein
VSGDFAVEAGDRVGFSLRWARAEEPEPQATPAADVAAAIEDVVEAWRSWEAEHDVYDGSRRERVRLSSRVLKGLTYRPTGAIVAAPTTSLPETIGGERDWDYRYAWIRDASLTLDALWIGTCPDEADDFVSWMEGAAGGHVHEELPLQIMYGVAGERDLAERELPHLRGHVGAGLSGSATVPGTRPSSTCTASSSMPTVATSTASRRVSPAHRRARPLYPRGDRARADRGRPRPPLPLRGRRQRRRGHVRDLLVLAGERARPCRPP